jgi:hypothetical protein
MKVALCVSGWARTLDQTVKAYFDLIINPIRQYAEVDVFAYTYTDDKNKDKYNLLCPVSFMCEPPIFININRTQRRAGFAKDTYALWGIQKCNIMKQMYEYDKGFKYDWIIRARPDTLHYRPIEDLRTQDPEKIHIPWFNNFKGLNDRFAFGGPRVMDIYSIRTGGYVDMLSRDWNYKEGVYQYYDRYTGETVYVSSELFLAQHMVKNKILFDRTCVMFSCVRDLSERPQDTSLNDFKPGMTGKEWVICGNDDLTNEQMIERYTKGLAT